MKKVTAEAFEDTSRPEGGHAVILIVGLDGLSDHPTFRLRPVDAGLAADHRGLWAGRSISPLATRQTERGTEFVVGPDIVDNPLLLAGTAVAIEIPEAMVRGEFLWPNVTSLAQPKRRHIVSARRPLVVEVEEAPAGQPLEAAAAAEDLKPAAIEDEPSGGVVIHLPVLAGASNDQSAWAKLQHSDADTAVILRRHNRTGGAADSAAQRSAKVWFASAAAVASLVVAFVMLVQSVRDKAAREANELDVASVSTTARHESVATTAGAVLTPPKLLEVAKPSPAPAPVNCDIPQISTDPLDGGRMHIRFTSVCRAGQQVRLAYGGADFVRHIDQSGAFDDIVDCFAGRASSVEIAFPDGRTKTVAAVANDFDRVTKIAVFWQAPVNLDLHVFEYAAKPGQKGHVWAKAPSDPALAQETVAADHRAHGFISTLGDGSNDQRKVEVYTLLHHSEQSSGLISMAVDFETRGETPMAASCRGGAVAEVPFQISVLDRRGQKTIQAGILAAAECGKQLGAGTRFDDTVLTPIKIGK